MLSTPCLCCPFSHISSASGSVSNCSQCWIVSCLWLSLLILFLWSFIVFWFSSKVIFGKKGKRTPNKMRFLIALQVVLLSRQFISLQANNASQSGDPISKPLTNQNYHDWWLICIWFIFLSVSNVTGLIAVGGLGVVDVEVGGRPCSLKPIFLWTNPLLTTTIIIINKQ